jgi:hypothetical protein
VVQLAEGRVERGADLDVEQVAHTLTTLHIIMSTWWNLF